MVLMTALREGVNPNSTTLRLALADEDRRPAVRLAGVPVGGQDLQRQGRRHAWTSSSATLASDNSVYAQLAADLGPDKVKETARMMGIKSKLIGYCAEIARRPRGTASRRWRWPTPTRRSPTAATATARARSRRSSATARSSSFRSAGACKRTKAFEDGVTYEATKILEANITGGTGGHAAIGCPAGRQDRHDRQEHRRLVRRLHAAAVDRGVGRLPGRRPALDERPVPRRRNIDGGTYPADIWGDYMKKAARQVLRRVQAPERAVPEPAVPGPLRA